MSPSRTCTVFLALLLLQAAPRVVLAHGDHAPAQNDSIAIGMSHGSGSHSSGMDRPMVMKDMEDFPDNPSYFLHHEHSSIMYAHIGLMILGWVVALPLAVMLSIARSRAALISQVVFLGLNTMGLVVGVVYNAQTPNLYENNAHHKLGWVVTCVAIAWLVLGIVHLYTRRSGFTSARPPLHPISQQAMAEFHQLEDALDTDRHRWSHDSGQGTEPMSSRSNSWNADEMPKAYKPDEVKDVDRDDVYAGETHGFLADTSIDRFLTSNDASIASTRVGALIGISYHVIERCMIPLSFLAIVTGVVTYSGIARGGHIFNVIAHLIKGGIFFWYGLLTFGRWMGCFSDLGWAWNLKPDADIVGRARARIPSAEFTESFVIFFYGASNVFLEHLGAWGKEWTAMDFEHVSITIMFFGGGLLGMLIESRRVRGLLSGALNGPTELNSPEWQTPRSYVHPLNPIPSLVILLLGVMMSNHTQHSLVSGQIHRQWGLLFAGFALSRTLTYIIIWLKPPTSFLPGRPPTELLAAFCLVSGGSVFMASNKDTINALEEYSLDSMLVFTVTMGLTCLIMAWTLIVVAVKGRAIRRRRPHFLAQSPTSP